jgi:hypothetical protein
MLRLIRPLSAAAFLCISISIARAENVPERLLPDTTQVYYRFDGLQSHREAFAKTAMGRTLDGEAGEWVGSLIRSFADSLEGFLTSQPVLGDDPPEQIVESIRAEVPEAIQLAARIQKYGVVVGLEVAKFEPIEFQLTVIFPSVGDEPKPFHAAMRLLTSLARLRVREIMVGERTIQTLRDDEIHTAWWIEGKDAIVTVGNAKPNRAVERVTAKDGRLTGHPLFQRLTAFKEFTPTARAFVDSAALVKVLRARDDESAKVIDELGLAGLKDIAYWNGCDGEAGKYVIEMTMPEPRKGLLALFRKQPFRLTDLPALPEDLDTLAASNIDPAATFDTLFTLTESIVKILDPDREKTVRAAVDAADILLGFDLRKDLLGSLQAPLVRYNASSDGPLFYGQVIGVKVKDVKVVREKMAKLWEKLGELPDATVSFHTKKYRGIELTMVKTNERGSPFLPTIAVTDGWLVASLFPQPIQAFILREQREASVWKPSEEVKRTFEKHTGDIVGVTMSDLRGTLQQLLSWAPLIVQALSRRGDETGIGIEIEQIPPAATFVRHLFADVGVSTDDGEKLRMVYRAAWWLPW